MPRYVRGLYSDSNTTVLATGNSTPASSSLYVAPTSTAVSTTLYFSYLTVPTITGGTATNAYTLYIAGAPSNTTNAYSLYINSGIVRIADTTASSSHTTGALVVSGGVGIAGNLYVNGSVFGTISGTISTSLVQVTSNGTVGSPAYSWSSDTSTGIYRIGASNIGISLGGTKYVDLSTTTALFANSISTTQIGTSTISSSPLYINPGSTAGLAATFYFSYFTAPTITGTQASTAYTIYVAGAPSNTLTSYALYIASGASYFGGLSTFSSGINTAYIVNSGFNLTVPTLSVADTISTITTPQTIKNKTFEYSSNTNISSFTIGGLFTTPVSHGLVVGDTIVFPNVVFTTGLTADLTYTVATTPTSTTFTLTGVTSISGSTVSLYYVITSRPTANYSSNGGIFKLTDPHTGKSLYFDIASSAISNVVLRFPMSSTSNVINFNANGGQLPNISNTITITGNWIFASQLTQTRVGQSVISSAPYYFNSASTSYSGSNNYYWAYYVVPPTSSSTTGAAYTIYIAGAPTGGTAAGGTFALYVAAGNTSLLGGLTLTGATSISSITGSSAIDFSGSSGNFKTTTGINNINGIITIAPNIYTSSSSLSATSGGSLIILNNTTSFTITLPSSSHGLQYYIININIGVVTIQVSNPLLECFNGDQFTVSISISEYNKLHIICYNNIWHTF